MLVNRRGATMFLPDNPSEDGTSELATDMESAIGGTRKNKEAMKARPLRHLSGV